LIPKYGLVYDSIDTRTAGYQSLGGQGGVLRWHGPKPSPTQAARCSRSLHNNADPHIFMFPVTVQAVVRKRTRNLCFDAHNLHLSGIRHTFDNFRQLNGSEIDSLKVLCHFGDFNLDEYVGVAL
jgi:hypothetical protein